MAGATLSEIVAEIGASKSTISLWVRDVSREAVRRRLGGELLDRHRAMNTARWARYEADRAERRAVVQGQGRAAATDAVIAAAAVAYWCEGSKSKPWRRAERLTFINSDPALIGLFLGLLGRLGVDAGRVTFRVHIHETADAAAAVRWWAARLGVAEERFRRPTVKRHRPTSRHNLGADYHGCLIVDVARSREAYWFVEGVVEAVVAAVHA